MRRALLALACLLAGGLGAPAVAGDTVHVRGRVLDQAGRAVRGATVSFELRPDRTLYNQHDCPVRPWEIQCRVHRVAGRTDAAGRYRLPVRLSSFLAEKRSHDLVVTDAPAPGVRLPAQTQIQMYFYGKSIDIPDLRLWRGRVSAAPDGPLHRMVRVEQPGAVFGRRHTPGPEVTFLQGDAVAWTVPAVTEDRQVDARVVEAGTTGVRASEVLILGRLFVTYRTPAYPLTGAARPVSRGAACATYGRADAVVPLAKCRFTDGRLATPIDPLYQRAGGKACDVAAQCAHPKWVRVDLGTAAPVGAVAVRGCVPGAIEVSPDGAAFAPYPTHDFGDGLLVGAPVPARYVRADLSRCTFKVTEISVFAPVDDVAGAVDNRVGVG